MQKREDALKEAPMRAGSGFSTDILPHMDAAYNLARWLVHEPATAEDVVQEAMLRALRYHAGLRGDPKPWLLRIVRNAAYATLSDRKKRGEVPLDCHDPVHTSHLVDNPEAALGRRQSLHALSRRLAALPPEQRECLVLRELEELSYKEIAQVTEVAVGTVMSRLWRARRTLLEEPQ